VEAFVGLHQHQHQQRRPDVAAFMNKKKSSSKKKNKPTAASRGFSTAAAADTKRPTPDSFTYAGDLRPGARTPQRTVHDEASIRTKPDYWKTGIPVAGRGKLVLPWMIEVKTPQEIEKMRAAGALAREILDFAGRMVEPGVTTEAIDDAVHKEIIKVCTVSCENRLLTLTSSPHSHSPPCDAITEWCLSVTFELSRLSQIMLYLCK
jgi:Xaa-Pro aminopeptidase